MMRDGFVLLRRFGRPSREVDFVLIVAAYIILRRGSELSVRFSSAAVRRSTHPALANQIRQLLKI